jgi:hypothetical protein
MKNKAAVAYKNLTGKEERLTGRKLWYHDSIITALHRDRRTNTDANIIQYIEMLIEQLEG